MQTSIHPHLVVTTVTCGSCGANFETRSTTSELRLDICSHCHPAYTGQPQRRPEGSRVERFNRRRRTDRATATAS